MSLIVVNQYKAVNDGICDQFAKFAYESVCSLGTLPWKITACVTAACSKVVDSVSAVFRHIFQCHDTPPNPQEEARAVQDRLYRVYKSKKLKEIIAFSQFDSSLVPMLVSRLLLEHIYDKKASKITHRELHNVTFLLHPDRCSHRKATALFQMHQQFLEVADLDNRNGQAGFMLWASQICFGWLIRLIIDKSLHTPTH